MKRYRITLDGETLEVKVLDDPRQDQVRVEIDGEVITVGVGTPESEGEMLPTSVPPPGPQLAATKSAAASSTVCAPLPGVIKLVHVRSGQRVSPEDELVTIEAMKMDNVIRAQREGVVAEILVTEGRQVTYGAPLLEYEE